MFFQQELWLGFLTGYWVCLCVRKTINYVVLVRMARQAFALCNRMCV
jgi:hypothetical protein